jgi:carbamoyltransferase
MHGAYLGPEFSSDEIGAWLDDAALPHTTVTGRARADRIAEAIDDGKVVGLFQGAMEFGPRALGHRSIIGDPRSSEMQSTMNLKIKYRESFRPFAPAVLAEKADDWFELATESPYMLLVAPVAHERVDTSALRHNHSSADLRSWVNERRSEIPAVTHVDGSARVQTVDAATSPLFREVLEAFDARTGCAVLINTSFNVRGEPIVCTPDDAYRCFMRTEMDVLVLEDHILFKEDQPAWDQTDDWRDEFVLD